MKLKATELIAINLRYADGIYFTVGIRFISLFQESHFQTHSQIQIQ